MKTKIMGWLIALTVLTAIVYLFASAYEKNKIFPDTIIKINEDVNYSDLSIDQKSDVSFPYKGKIHYFLPVGSPLKHEGYVYAFKFIPNSSKWKVDVLKKTKNGYVIQSDEDKGFLIESLKEIGEFGYSGYMVPTKLNGTLTITFKTEDSFYYLSDLHKKRRWKDAYRYMYNVKLKEKAK